MKVHSPSQGANLNSAGDYVRRAHNAMREWGDLDRDDDILEGACEVRYLDEAEILAAAIFLRQLEDFILHNSKNLVELLPALLQEAAGGSENLASEHGITIPRCATARREAGSEALRRLSKQR